MSENRGHTQIRSEAATARDQASRLRKAAEGVTDELARHVLVARAVELEYLAAALDAQAAKSLIPDSR